MFDNPFSDKEIQSRIEAVRKDIAARKLDAAVFASPENVFYLTGLDHWGYFTPHLLIVPLEGAAVLVTRAMERVSVEKQVTVGAVPRAPGFRDGSRHGRARDGRHETRRP